jgi:hypothetical protein
MIRRLITREGQRLLDEFDAPDWPTLRRRIIFYGSAWGSTALVLGGLIAVYENFGMAAFWGAVLLIVLMCLRMQRHTPVYFGDGEIFRLGGGTPALPPPGKPALPAPGAPQIGRSSTALTSRHRPTLPKRSPK